VPREALAGVNETPAYLLIDGYPAESAERLTERPPWRLHLYGGTSFHHLLHLSASAGAGATLPAGAFPELSTAECFALPEGEALRSIAIVREVAAGELQDERLQDERLQGEPAVPLAPTRRGAVGATPNLAYSEEALSA
jgi:hypothetical protein